MDAGSYYANVSFDHPNYDSVLTNATFTVGKAVNNVNVSVEDLVYGEMAVIVVSADVDGAYLICVNGTNVTVDVMNGRGNASLSLDAGSYYANVTFNDYENYNVIIDNAVFSVLKADNPVVVSAANVSYGDDVTVLISAAVDGVYVLDVNGSLHDVSVAGGVGSLVLSLPVGDYYANVTFDADDNYNNLISNAVFSVLPYANYDMVIGVNTPIYGDDLLVSVRLPQNATGNLSFMINDNLYSSMLIDGYAKFNIPDLHPGDYVLSVMYGGDEYYDGKTANINVHVKNLSMAHLYDATYGWAKSITYQARLIDEDGNAVSNREVLFSIAGKLFKSYSDVDGYARVSLGLNIGVYNITVSSLYGKITKKVSVVSRFSSNKNVNMYYFDGSKYSFKVYGNDGKLVGANQVVVVKLNKKTYKIKTNKNGVACLTIPKTVKPGKYTITASYNGQTIRNEVKVKKILSSKKRFKVKRTAKKLVLKAKLKRKLKGKKITFRLNGKKYRAKTNKKGIAKVTVKKNRIKKLKKGKTYKVRVSYYKTRLYTKVKVK